MCWPISCAGIGTTAGAPPHRFPPAPNPHVYDTTTIDIDAAIAQVEHVRPWFWFVRIREPERRAHIARKSR
jgi:hypothetical protein